MAKDKKKDRKDRDDPKAVKGPGERGTAGSEGAAGHAAGGGADAGHHAAKAHGRPTQVDTSLPATRPELMELHAAARARRNGADLGSPEFRAAVMDLEKIEVRIAAIDRAADPPLG
jgi:hypothetical protein